LQTHDIILKVVFTLQLEGLCSESLTSNPLVGLFFDLGKKLSSQSAGWHYVMAHSLQDQNIIPRFYFTAVT
jgi:hypothetical protein